MFDNWPVDFSPAPWRVVDPPRRVLVAANVAIPTKPKYFGVDKLPMRVRLGGLRLGDRIPGWLYAWVQLNDGTWMALVVFTLVTGNGHGQLEMRQWCPAHALMPADESR